MSDRHVIGSYRSFLQNYSLEQLRFISAEGVWSIGQMYDHMILVAHEYLDNVEHCARSHSVQELGKTVFGEQLFREGGFPPIKIKLPDELNGPPNNTDSKQTLLNRLFEVEMRLNEWAPLVDEIHADYKVKHGGFGWLNAKEWYDLVDMHFRHHLRQWKELDQKLVF
ncbi:DinB family protein [Paenibacillus aestuarii]|uniref:DinB family protein n=1 Tax=Paenibacillus aestuarii TaxID=516965 RepID=A0ABW0K2S2_9BACL|nr:DinB family protein [Paenibacillus aestuarii]